MGRDDPLLPTSCASTVHVYSFHTTTGPCLIRVVVRMPGCAPARLLEVDASGFNLRNSTSRLPLTESWSGDEYVTDVTINSAASVITSAFCDCK